MADPPNHVPASAPSTRTRHWILSTPCGLPIETNNNQYPMNMAVDFTRLRPSALRRYMAFHDLPEVPGSSREQLAVTVARHFQVECKTANESSSIMSFVTFLTGSSDTAKAAEIFRARPLDRLQHKQQDYGDDKANPGRQRVTHIGEEVEGGLDGVDVDDLHDHDQGDEAELDAIVRPLMVKECAVNQSNKKCGARGQGEIDRSDTSAIQTKKRKGRLYCICKGGSFGNMIACDNKKCFDRSNWYHMSCVGLNSLDKPPETWYCPACQENDLADVPENQYRKPVASVTYGDMISHALTLLPEGKGSFKDICDFIENEYESQLNWKLESDQRKSPVWKSSVRKILFSNVRFQKHPKGKGMFCLAT